MKNWVIEIPGYLRKFCRSLHFAINQVPLYINFHVSWHPYQFAPLLFCHFLRGLIAFPDEFKMYLETVKVRNDCLTVRKDVDIPACVVLFYCITGCCMCYMQSLSEVPCVTKSVFQHARSYHNINAKARISQTLYC
jgi:hypothetical protein